MVAMVVKIVLLTLIVCDNCFFNRKRTQTSDLANTWDMIASFQVAPPKLFNFSRPNEWTKWIRRFERYKSASGLEKKSVETKVDTLIYTMGAEVDDIFQSFGLSDDDKKKYKTVKAKFESHFVKRRNVIYERAMFNKRKQEEGETVDSFITSLYSLTEHCGYGVLREEMIRDRIVIGIRDAALSLKLQLMEKLTLDQALTKVREAEAIKSQQPLLRSDVKDTKSGTTANMSAVHKRGPGNKGGTHNPILNRSVSDVADLLHTIDSIVLQKMWYTTSVQKVVILRPCASQTKE